MGETDEKGGFQADIPANAIEAALRSVEKVEEAAGAPAPDGEVPVEVEGGGAADLAREVESLRAQLESSTSRGRETLERLKDEHERLLRAAADLENYKKRAAREREEIQRFGVERLVKDLLPAVDDLDRALAAAPADDPLAAGVRLVRASLEQALAKHGVVGFSALGERFDPALHEALLQVPTSDQAPGTVVVEHARGFKLNDRLVRPAMVGVAVEPPPAS
ncbi:MAG TPA: nucleotide exchange factor GrpE [Anaeromyxobacter sp.]|nr:nucleotide exchange factor GrpE [Anaeromyxobacter sp.]